MGQSTDTHSAGSASPGSPSRNIREQRRLWAASGRLRAGGGGHTWQLCALRVLTSHACTPFATQRQLVPRRSSLTLPALLVRGNALHVATPVSPGMYASRRGGVHGPALSLGSGSPKSRSFPRSPGTASPISRTFEAGVGEAAVRTCASALCNACGDRFHQRLTRWQRTRATPRPHLGQVHASEVRGLVPALDLPTQTDGAHEPIRKAAGTLWTPPLEAAPERASGGPTGLPGRTAQRARAFAPCT